MKLYANIQSERGKQVYKTGNDYINIEIKDSEKKLVGYIGIKATEKNMIVGYVFSEKILSHKMISTKIAEM